MANPNQDRKLSDLAHDRGGPNENAEIDRMKREAANPPMPFDDRTDEERARGEPIRARAGTLPDAALEEQRNREDVRLEQRQREDASERRTTVARPEETRSRKTGQRAEDHSPPVKVTDERAGSTSGVENEASKK